MNIFLNQLDKADNENNDNFMKRKSEEMIRAISKINKKKLKDFKILQTILEERDVEDEIINKRNHRYVKILKRRGYKISEKKYLYNI